MSKIIIRKTKPDELDDVMNIYANARKFMADNDNPNQGWNFGPPRDLIEQDINDGVSFVCIEKDNPNKILGVFAALEGPDSTYKNIVDGQGLNDSPYIVIHRIASSFASHGVLKAAVNFSLKQSNNVRIDTYPPNKPMMNGLKKLGFVECGTIFVRGNEPRRAFQLVSK